jgi:hypothetical protein
VHASQASRSKGCSVLQDALSKTIPIWAAVLNRAIHRQRSSNSCASPAPKLPAAADSPHARPPQPLSLASILPPVKPHNSPGQSLPIDTDSEQDIVSIWDTELHTPLFISQTERESMLTLLPSFVDTFLSTCNGALPEDLFMLQKPLRPLWISQLSHIVTNQVAQPSELSFHPIILVSASFPALYWRRQIYLPAVLPSQEDLLCLHTPQAACRDSRAATQASPAADRCAGESQTRSAVCVDAQDASELLQESRPFSDKRSLSRELDGHRCRGDGADWWQLAERIGHHASSIGSYMRAFLALLPRFTRIGAASRHCQI